MKRKVEYIYHRVMRSLHTHTRLPLHALTKSRSATAVLCRVVLVTTLLQLGITEPSIQRASGWSQQRVNHIKNHTAPKHLNTLECRILRRQVWNEVSYLKRDED